MKYALISEEQIENLKGLTSVLIRLGHPYNAGLCVEILESLKLSEPVGYKLKKPYSDVFTDRQVEDYELVKWTPLYALEKSE